MTKVRANVVRFMHPPTVAEHYFKLENRLRRWLGLKISLTVANFDHVDWCLGYAMLGFEMSETEFDRRVVLRKLRTIIQSDLAVSEVMAFVGSKHDIERTLLEEVNSLILAKLPQNFRRNFSHSQSEVEQVRSACAAVINDLKSLKAKAGRKPNDWYDLFAFGMWSIATWSGINLSTQDRAGVKLRTPFLDLVSVYEMCLPREMRSTSRQARAKRIQVSLRRLKERGWLSNPPKF